MTAVNKKILILRRMFKKFDIKLVVDLHPGNVIWIGGLTPRYYITGTKHEHKCVKVKWDGTGFNKHLNTVLPTSSFKSTVLTIVRDIIEQEYSDILEKVK